MTALFGPGWGNAALDGFVEVQLPEPVSLWPQTPGWWFVLVLLLLGLGRFALDRYRNYRLNQYRRDALQALGEVRRRLHDGEREALRELAPLLRATAMRANPLMRAVGQDDDTWMQTLHELSPDMPQLPLRRVHELAYAALPETVDGEMRTLPDQLEQWIRQHERRDA